MKCGEWIWGPKKNQFIFGAQRSLLLKRPTEHCSLNKVNMI